MAEDDHEHAHSHGALAYLGADASDETIARLRATHPDLADNLELTRRFATLSAEEKERAVATQRKVEGHHAWLPGYHAPGDRCVACGKATMPLFTDKFESGALPYAAFVANLPVHAESACLAALAKSHPKPSPREVDRLRREFTKDVHRPSASMAMFFRHDVLAHPPFDIESWANSVAESNPNLDKPTMRDMERLMHWTHHRLYH